MTAGQSGGKAPIPSQDAELREDIERTRQQLGETVEALAAKTDVTGRTRRKASLAKEQAAVRAGQVKEQATARMDQVRGQVAEKAVRTKQNVLAASRPAREQIEGSAEVTGAAAWQALPDRVQDAARQAAASARRSNPAVLAAVAVAALLACIAIVRRSRK